MSLEGALVKFVAKEDEKIYFASFELHLASLLTEKNLAPKPPTIGTVLQAESHILGYTVGNDLSCRFFQLPNNSGGQFYFAKAFDKFAPIGPALVSPKHFDAGASTRRLTTKVNGKIVQDTLIAEDMIFSLAQILSQMSQGLS